MKLLKSLFSIGSVKDDCSGTQVCDVLLNTKHLRIVTSFDDYSPYNKEMSQVSDRVNGERIYLSCKYLFTLPFGLRYRWNNKGQIFKVKPMCFWVSKKPKYIKVSVDMVKQILDYCEKKDIYDKLGAYGDFYYKLKRKI